MGPSPIEELLAAVDRLDLDATTTLFARDCRLLTADGRSAEGKERVSELIEEFLAAVRSVRHQVTAHWHQHNVWIAEVEAVYELKDFLRTGALRRAFILREGPEGVTALHVYGANERQLANHRTGEEGMRIGGRWIPPL